MWFATANAITFAIWIGSIFDPALYVLRISSHPGKWVWLNENLCFIDIPLVKHMKRLNLAGYETTNCCQGEDFLIGTSQHLHTPYIAAKSLPVSFMKDCSNEGFRVYCSIHTQDVAVYARKDSVDDTKPGAAQRNFDALVCLLDKWHQDSISMQE
jgi:hypothetical protein